jgi:hypothetical protein
VHYSFCLRGQSYRMRIEDDSVSSSGLLFIRKTIQNLELTTNKLRFRALVSIEMLRLAR